MQAIIIANCTHAPIREYFAATGLFDRVESMPLYTIPREEYGAIHDRLDRFDLIVALSHGAQFAQLSHGALKARFAQRCLIVTTPFFSGLHPDLVHVSVAGRRKVASPLSDYHPGLILWGYLTGRSIDRIEAMYRDGMLPDLFDAETCWARGIAELEARDRETDVPIADIVDRVCRACPAMLTFNHPTAPILTEIAQRILTVSGLFDRVPALDPSSVFNHLLSDIRFPVSPAALRINRLAYDVSPVFRCGNRGVRPGAAMTFREVAGLCYDSYAGIDTGRMQVSTPAHLAAPFQAVIDAQRAP